MVTLLSERWEDSHVLLQVGGTMVTLLSGRWEDNHVLLQVGGTMVTLLSPSNCRDIRDSNQLHNMSGEIITYSSYMSRRSELSHGM
jgi:hypothetical protein